MISISIVSHGQAALVCHLLDDLFKLGLCDIEVLITINIPEDAGSIIIHPLRPRIFCNSEKKGFGANHNAAFEKSRGEYFAVVNPDVRLPSLDMQLLLRSMEEVNVGVVAPVVLNSCDRIEDSVRHFPTFIGLVGRVALRRRLPEYSWDSSPLDVDWAAGMFLLFRAEAFATVRGFDQERFFMYYEDVDICKRLKTAGWRVILEPSVSVVHDAQRDSHRSLKYLWWHITSAMRYLTGL